MKCLKCGKETTREQVFCSGCLESMEAYPVKPGTPIHLPKRTVAAVPRKAPRRKVLSPEEQIVQLKKRSRWLFITVASLILVLGITIGALDHTWDALRNAKNTGKNFMVETSPPSTEDVSRETSEK